MKFNFAKKFAIEVISKTIQKIYLTINYFTKVVKDIKLKSVIRIGAFYLAMFQLMATNYELQLNVAILERNSVESLIGDDKLNQAIKGLGRAQRERVPQKPNLLFPWTIFPFDPQPIFKERLHEEIVVALEEYADQIKPDVKYCLNLAQADLREIYLRKADLSKILAYRAKMINADLSGTNLSEAILNATDMTRAKLRNARLINARLYKANLAKAELINADLSYSMFLRTDLSYSKLDSVTFLEVNLHGANLTGASLTGIKSWKNIKSIKNANIKKISFKDKNDTEDFRNWALSEEQGAVEMAKDEWERWKKANFHPPKNWIVWKDNGFEVDRNGIPVESSNSKVIKTISSASFQSPY